MKIPKEIRENKGNGSMRDRGCNIKECPNHAIKNLPEQEWDSYIKLSGLTYLQNRNKRIYLCRYHYSVVHKEKRRINKKNSREKGFLTNSPKPTKMRY